MKTTTLKEEDQKALKSMAESYAEAVHVHSAFLSDPFDLYAESLKSKFYSDAGHFSHRFISGYQALLQELDKET